MGKGKRTESVECGADNHESVALALAQGRVVLVRDFVGGHEETQAKNTDQDTLEYERAVNRSENRS